MSTVEPLPAPNPQADETNESWLSKTIRLWGYTHLAHDGMMVDKINKQNAHVLRTAQFAATGDAKTLLAPEEGEDMGVNIGNEHKEYHYHYEQNPQTASSTVSGVTSTLAKLVTAGVIGAGGMAIYNQIAGDEAPAPPPAAEFNEKDWQLGVEVKD